MQKFVNRVKELEALEKQYAANQSALVIVYGRRRVGKTALITEFLKRHSNSLYFLATEESEMQNLNYFKFQVAEFTGNELLKSAAVDWITVFKTLIDYRTETKKIIVLDEFQYIGQSNSAFPSVMQKVWDTLLKDANVMLILCGSLVSLMKSQTLDYSSPLYGRRTGQIKLKQIPFSHYHEFFEGRENLRWSKFKQLAPDKMLKTYREEVFPLLGEINSALKDSVCLITKPSLLDTAVQTLDKMDFSEHCSDWLPEAGVFQENFLVLQRLAEIYL